MTILQFMAAHPIQTFLLALIALQALVYISRYVAYAIRGDPKILEDKDDEL